MEEIQSPFMPRVALAHGAVRSTSLGASGDTSAELGTAALHVASISLSGLSDTTRAVPGALRPVFLVCALPRRVGWRSSYAEESWSATSGGSLPSSTACHLSTQESHGAERCAQSDLVLRRWLSLRRFSRPAPTARNSSAACDAAPAHPTDSRLSRSWRRLRSVCSRVQHGASTACNRASEPSDC